MTTILLNVPIIAFLVFFSIYDIRYQKVRNPHLLLFLPVVLLVICTKLRMTEITLAAIADMVIGGLICGGLMLLSAYITNGGIGGGDIKLCFLLGFLTGTVGAMVMLLVQCVCACIYGLAKSRWLHNRILRIPLVPFTSVGFLASIGYSLL